MWSRARLWSLLLDGRQVHSGAWLPQFALLHGQQCVWDQLLRISSWHRPDTHGLFSPTRCHARCLRWNWLGRTRSCATSAASTTCAARRRRRWSGWTWLRSKSWIWGQTNRQKTTRQTYQQPNRQTDKWKLRCGTSHDGQGHRCWSPEVNNCCAFQE